MALDLSSEKIYWGDHDGMERANLDGSNVEGVGGFDIHAIAVDGDGGKIYMGEGNGGRILRTDLDGLSVEVLAEPDSGWIEGLALDLANGKVYWVGGSSGEIVRGGFVSRDVNGTIVETFEEELVLEPSGSRSLAVNPDGGKVYFGQLRLPGVERALLQADLDLTNVEPLVHGAYPHGIALDVDKAHLYWTGIYNDTSGVWRANLDGTDVEQVFEELTLGIGLIRDIALDLREIPEPMVGDVNLDGVVNGLDVDPFVEALLSGSYQPEADMNEDQVVNGLDVDPFVAAVVDGTQPVPEPSTLVFVIVTLGLLAGRRKWSHALQDMSHITPMHCNYSVRYDAGRECPIFLDRPLLI